MSLSVLPMFSSKSFIVSGLKFRPLTHFVYDVRKCSNFIVSGLTFRPLTHFVYDVRKCSNFTLFHAAVRFSQHHLLKRLSLNIVYSCPLSQK